MGRLERLKDRGVARGQEGCAATQIPPRRHASSTFRSARAGGKHRRMGGAEEGALGELNADIEILREIIEARTRPSELGGCGRQERKGLDDQT